MNTSDRPGDVDKTYHLYEMESDTVNPADASTAAPAIENDPVRARLLADEIDGQNVKTPLMLGAVVSVFFAVVLGLAVTFVLYMKFDTSLLGPAGWTIVMLVLTAGLCYGIDRATHGRRWADTQIAGPIFHPILDKLLFSYRFLVGGYQRKQRADAVLDEAVIARGARLVRALGAAGVPMMPARLIEPGDTPQSLDLVIDHLTLRDWIGHSSDGQKLWLSSKAKNLMIQWGLTNAV